MKKNERIAKLLESLLSSVSSALKAPICKTAVELDLRSSLIRVQEASPSPTSLCEARWLTILLDCSSKLVRGRLASRLRRHPVSEDWWWG